MSQATRSNKHAIHTVVCHVHVVSELLKHAIADAVQKLWHSFKVQLLSSDLCITLRHVLLVAALDMCICIVT